MGWLKKLKKKLTWKNVGSVVKSVVGAVPVIGGILKSGINIAEKLAKKAGAVIGKAEKEFGAVKPPGKMNWGLLAIAAAAIWLLFSPNPGLLTALFAGPVSTRVRTSRRKGKTTTKVTVAKATKRKKSKKGKRRKKNGRYA